MRVNVDLFSDGNNLHARFSPGDALNFEETRYYLREMIVHLPGEHRIPAVVPDVEIQLVHESEDGKKLMLAVMVQEGSSHTEWAHINEALPLAPSGVNKVMGFWVERLLPRRRGYYQYTGSETIPPCTEGVQWLVMDESISFSGSQIDKLSRLFPKSARPLQASNARRVLHSR